MRARAHSVPSSERGAALLMLSLASAVVWLGSAMPVRINWTRSAPVGLYSMHRAAAVTRNDLVVVCLPGAGTVWRWRPKASA